MTRKGSTPLIVGAGVAGLAAGIALARKGVSATTIDKASHPSPAGGGIQLGPNAVRVLRALGVSEALEPFVGRPERVVVYDLSTCAARGTLSLGARFQDRYGAPYLTLLRSDLNRVLLEVHQQCGLEVQWQSPVAGIAAHREGLQVSLAGGGVLRTACLIGADGLWSSVRSALPAASLPQPTGQTALRAVVPAEGIDAAWAQSVCVFSAPGRHVVSYPVQAGRSLALVVIVPSSETLAPGWGSPVSAQSVAVALAPVHPDLQSLLNTATTWLAWPLWAAPPVRSWRSHAHERTVLVGDAAHPMRPHLAQGAAMGLEDALVLGNVLGATDLSHPQAALAGFAKLRWRRNARVQARAIRTGKVFQFAGPAAWARDLALRLLSETLMDQPAVYAYDASRVGHR